MFELPVQKQKSPPLQGFWQQRVIGRRAIDAQNASTHGLANQWTIPDELQEPLQLSKAVGS